MYDRLIDRDRAAMRNCGRSIAVVESSRTAAENASLDQNTSLPIFTYNKMFSTFAVLKFIVVIRRRICIRILKINTANRRTRTNTIRARKNRGNRFKRVT